MSRRPRRSHARAFKAQVALAAIKSDTLDNFGRIFPSGYPATTIGSFEGRRRSTLPAQSTIAVAVIGLVEFLCIAATAFFAAIAYGSFAHTPHDFTRWYAEASFFLAASEVCIAVVLGQFTHVQKQRRIRFAWSGVGSVAITFVLVTSLLFLLKLSDVYSRGTLVLQLLGCLIGIVAIRLGTYSCFQAAAAKGFILGQRIVLVGTWNDCALHAKQLRKSGGGLQIDFCTITPTSERDKLCTIDRSMTSSVVERCRRLQPNSIILLADNMHDDKMTSALAFYLREVPADIYAVPIHGAEFWLTACPGEIGGVPAFALSRRPLSVIGRAIKRTFDIIAAMTGLIILSPLLLFACAAVAIDSKGPIFFRQIRHGYNNQPISVLKFRTMYVADEKEFLQASKGDSRITRVGKVFRVTGIDELPQLWNILCGEMSVVGPRPHAIPHNELFLPKIESFYRRHTVTPGLTGWAQVNGFRGETDTLEKMQKRIEHDLYYIENWSLLFDLQIIILTLFSGKTYMNAR